jgi:VIT1/CCC1 family predicted Fe2+/Mn2+ transporter
VNPFFANVRDSFRASASEIVFGMEDGAVSILGLVLGVATSARSSSVVLLAGAAGTAAASVSMMAGAYLGVESARDVERVHLAFHEKAIRAHPAKATDELMASLTKAGLGAHSLAAIRADTARDPRILRELQVLFTGDPSQRDIATAGRVSPIAHAAWMFASDLLAGLTPVVPFMFLALAPARVVSVASTLVLLLALGAGRARLAQRPFARTVLETVGVAALAAIAGVAVGVLLPGA